PRSTTGRAAWPACRASWRTPGSTSTATCSWVAGATGRCSPSSSTTPIRPVRSSSARGSRWLGMDDAQRYLFDLQGWITIADALDAARLATLNEEFDRRVAAVVPDDANSWRFGDILDWGRSGWTSSTTRG